MKNKLVPSRIKKVALILLILTCGPAKAGEIFFAVQDQQGNSFVGESNQAGFESKIQAVKYQSEFINDRETPAGQIVQGKGPSHGPIKLTKKLGAASPSFLRALTENEPLTIMIDFVSPHRTGRKVATHSLIPQNSKLSSIKQYSEPMGSNLGHVIILEEMTFTFENFELKNLLGVPSPRKNAFPRLRRK